MVSVCIPFFFYEECTSSSLSDHLLPSLSYLMQKSLQNKFHDQVARYFLVTKSCFNGAPSCAEFHLWFGFSCLMRHGSQLISKIFILCSYSEVSVVENSSESRRWLANANSSAIPCGPPHTSRFKFINLKWGPGDFRDLTDEPELGIYQM